LGNNKHMKNIIIMEDDLFLKEFYSFVFKKVGYAADLLEDGDVFFQKLNSQNYDLIIMDLSLKNTYYDGKKVNGINLSQLVKKNERLKKIPIVLVTAHAVDSQSKHLFDESLADAYIIKPISDIKIFISKIESMME
ncbi:MAG: response regulator, partial [Melioribacteraceae bacterium]|nr:response regulator [Melioribacteraceae bacterium]